MPLGANTWERRDHTLCVSTGLIILDSLGSLAGWGEMGAAFLARRHHQRWAPNQGSAWLVTESFSLVGALPFAGKLQSWELLPTTRNVTRKASKGGSSSKFD